MSKYGMKVSRDFVVTITKVVDVEPSDLAGLPVIERPSDPDNDVMDELEEKAEREQDDNAPVFIHNDEAYWAAVDALNAGDDEAMNRWAHDEAHRRFDERTV